MSSAMLQPCLPTIVVKVLDEANGLFLSLGLVVLMAYLGLKGYYSGFLGFCGSISYEIFLLHGAFLVKYNPIIVRDEAFLPFSFMFFLSCIIALSWVAHRGFLIAYGRRNLLYQS